MEVTLKFKELNTVEEVKNCLGSVPKANLVIFQKVVDSISFQPSLLLMVRTTLDSDLVHSYKYEVRIDRLFEAGIEFTLYTPPMEIRI